MPATTTDELFDSLEKARIRRCEILLKLLELLRQMNFLGEKNAAAQRALSVLRKHVKAGGDLLSHEIPLDYAELYSQVLRANRVPFYSSLARDPKTGLDVSIFLTRDLDERAVARAIELYIRELNAGLGEISLIDFAKKYEGMDTDARAGLGEAELELFRIHAAKEEAEYSVEKDAETGLFILHYSRMEDAKIEKALRLMAYDFSGDEGIAFHERVDQSLGIKHAFEKQLSAQDGEVLYVVDSENPGRFVSIDANAFGMHNLRQVDEAMPNGEVRTVVKDENSQYFPVNEREMLMTLVDQLHEPVLLTEEEMTLIKEIAPNGVAIPNSTNPKLLAQVFSELKETLAERDDIYRKKALTELIGADEKIGSLKDLPPEVIMRLTDMIGSGKLKRTAITGNSVSYEASDKAAVEECIHEMLYAGLEGIALTATKMHYEGRGELDLSAQRTQYLINADLREYVLKLNEEGLFIYNGDELQTSFMRDEPGFENNLNESIRRFPNVVVLTQEEFVSAERDEIIRERLPFNQNSEAKAVLTKRDEMERSQLAEGTFTSLTDRQSDALKYTQRFTKKEYHIKHGVLERKTKTVTEDRIRPQEGRSHALEESNIEH